MPNLLSESKTPISSSRRKSVFLHEWWLIKVGKESKLGVEGFVNKETLGARGMRPFGSASTGKRSNINTIEYGIQLYGSAAIAKRHDSNTLEAVDGIIIRISGCINKSRTLSYGFSPEVCVGFLSGFPCSWEDYASTSPHDKCANKTKQSLPVSFDDLPVTRVRDLLISSESDSRALTSIILKDILKHTEKSLDQSVSPNKVSKKSTETEVDHKQDEIVSLLNTTQEIIEDEFETPRDSDLENLKETEDDVCMLDEMNKITQEKQSEELSRRYPLRSTRKRKTIEKISKSLR